MHPRGSLPCPQKPRVMAGTVKLEDKQRLAQEEESEAKRLAIMMMKKREKYLYNKIMFGKRRKVREVSPCHPPEPPGVATWGGCAGELGPAGALGRFRALS